MITLQTDACGVVKKVLSALDLVIAESIYVGEGREHGRHYKYSGLKPYLKYLGIRVLTQETLDSLMTMREVQLHKAIIVDDAKIKKDPWGLPESVIVSEDQPILEFKVGNDLRPVLRAVK